MANTTTSAKVPRPYFLYGTAWKEERTSGLVELALAQGFRAFDTANQRKHYHEAGMGQALAQAIRRGEVARDDLFLQTKFTFQAGQDHRLPYDPKSAVAEQVEQSFASSLEHLGVETLDSYLLHGPSQRNGLAAADWEAWRAMERIHDSGRVGLLGVSNVALDQLQSLCGEARVLPAFVQNRCYAARGWDRAVREFCQANTIAYQGFSLLTANRTEMASPAILEIARRYGRTVAQIVFRYALSAGMLPLTGTTDASHMREDLAAADFELTSAEIGTIEDIGQY